MDYIFENERVGLKLTTADEIDVIYRIERKSANYRYVSAYEKPRHLEVITSENEEHLTIWNKETHSLLGFVILGGLNNQHLSLELRRIIVDQRNQGFGRSVLRLIKHYCFVTLRFNRLWLDVFTDNLPAIGLYSSEGFTREGTLRDVIKSGDTYRSMHIYAMIKQEFLYSK